MIPSENLRVLFPSLFSRLGDDPHIQLSRDWETLRIPRLRLMGPNWSFSAILKEVGDGYDLATLAESELPQKLKNKKILHRPTYFRAGIAGAYGGYETKYKESRSRYSAVAINLLAEGTEPYQPFGPPGTTNPIDTTRTSSLILSPIGKLPYNQHDQRLYLHSCRLLVGEIWAQPVDGWCSAARAVLGLGEPASGDKDWDTIVFLPDGFALRGTIKLPWEDAPLAAWFKATSLREKVPGGNALQLWIDQPLGKEWTTALETFRGLIRGVPKNGSTPFWFDMQTTGSIGLGSLRWPCRVDNEILLARETSGPLEITSDALHVRLGAQSGGASGRLAIRPVAFTVREADDGSGSLEVSSDAEHKFPEAGEATSGSDTSRSDMRYDFLAAGHMPTEETAVPKEDDGPVNSEATETLDIGRVSEDGQSRNLALAVPLIANTTRMREAMGFGDPPAKTGPQDGDLWLFTPIRSGWLHWAVPNMTVARAAKLTETDHQKSEAEATERSIEREQNEVEFATAGLWSLAPGADTIERNWAVTLANAKDARFVVRFTEVDSVWHLTRVHVGLADLSVSCDGLVPVTAFAQTGERLVPEAEHRALRAAGLNGRTPNLLAGVEETLWEEKKALIRADVKTLRLLPPRKGSGITGAAFAGEESTPAVSLSFVRPSPAGQAPQPWVWVRHDRLPTFQTMPLATTGDADRQPSSLRELAPLVLPEETVTNLTFTDAFDMTKSGPGLDTNALAAAVHPMAGAEFTFEVGQAVTTLPSLTLKPGLGTSPGLWAQVPTATENVLRHDIALTDEYYTLARLPPPPRDPKGNGGETEPEAEDKAEAETEAKKEPEKVSAPIGFEPLPYNAPGAWGNAAWDPVWSGHTRALALSAAGQRTLFADGQFHDVFADAKWDGTVELDDTTHIATADPETAIYEPDLAADRVLSVGRLAVKIDNLLPETPFDGLPATTDLSGLNLETNGFAVQRGALKRYSLEKADGATRHADQAGFAFDTARRDGDTILRDVARYVPKVEDAAAAAPFKREWVQASLSRPLRLAGAGSVPLQFHFRDMLLKSAGELFALSTTGDKADFDLGLDGSQPDTALSHGFAWSLAHEPEDPAGAAGDEQKRNRRPAGYVTLGWLLFEPLALSDVEIDAEGTFTRAVIRGRVGLPGDDDGEVVAAGGDAVLELQGGGKNPLVWSLDVASLDLPLSDDDDVPGGPPRLQAEMLSFGQDATLEVGSITGGKLDFLLAGSSKSGAEGLGGATMAVDLTDIEALGGRLVLKSADGMTIVALPPLIEGDENDVEARRRFQLTLTTQTITLELNQWRNLMTGEISEHADKLGIGCAKTAIPVVALPTFGEGTIAVDWTVDQSNPQTLLGMPVSAGRGALLGEFSVDADGNQTVGALTHVFMLQLGTALYLDFDSALPEAAPLLSGTFAAPNVFSWPELSLEFVPGAPIGVTPTGARIRHDVTLQFDRTRIATTDLTRGKMHLNARAEHSLSRDGQTVLTWSVYQPVTLWSSDQLAQHLNDRSDADDTYSLALQGGGNDLRPGVIETAGTGHWGLTPDRMRKLAAALDSGAEPVPVIDISAHHLLGSEDADARGLHALPLPGFVMEHAVGGGFSYAVPDGAEFQRLADPAIENGFPAFGAVVEVRLRERLQDAARSARENRTGLADALTPIAPDEHHRPLFQSATTVRADGATLEENSFWAETAIWLSAGLGAFEEGAPRAAHTLVGAGWLGDEMVDEPFVVNKITQTTSNAHARIWSHKFLSDVANLVYPNPPSLPAKSGAAQLRLLAIGTRGGAPDVVARYVLDANHPANRNRSELGIAELRWAADALAKLAPHARIGLLLRIAQGPLGPLTADAMKAVISKAPGLGRATRTSTLAQIHGGAQRQRSLRPVHYSLSELFPGFEPAGPTAATLTDEAGTLPDEGQTALRLTASGASFASRLPTAARQSMEKTMWLTSRETMAFRREDDFDSKNSKTVTPALPPGYAGTTPAAMLSVRAGDAILPADAKGKRSVIPPFVSEGVVAPRSGVWLSHRLGIEAGDPKSDMRWSASERPQWIRTPRPVELGVNDRTRASAFEPRPMDMADLPQALLFGAARSLSAHELARIGLDRRPRAADAVRVQLHGPRRGLLTDGWTGDIVLSMAESFGQVPDDVEDPAWTVAEAILTLGDDVFTLEPANATLTPSDPSATLTLSGFTARLKDGSTVRATAHARALPFGTPCHLMLICERDHTPRRRIGFRLWRAGGRLIEAPFYLRFEDPSYNDRLTGLAKLARKDAPGTRDEVLAVAENGEARPRDYIETGLALAAKGGGREPELKFEAVDVNNSQKLFIVAPPNEAGEIFRWEVAMTFQVRRASEPKAIDVEFGGMPAFSLLSGAFVSLPLRLAQLKRAGGQFALEADDQLTTTVTATSAELEDFSVDLVLDIVDRPLLPPNPAIYHMLSLAVGGERTSRVRAPLQVTSPDPILIELVDPKEMVSGIVRRRAIYQWASFLPPEQRTDRFCLQKVASTGASWLSNDLSAHWIRFDNFDELRDN